MDKKRYCPKCGKKITDSMKYCPRCGHHIIRDKKEQQSIQNSETKSKRSKSKETKYKVVNSILIVLIIIAIGTCFLQLRGKSGNSKSNTQVSSSSVQQNKKLTSDDNHQASTKYTDQEYALAAYLKLQDQLADDLQKDVSNMHWKQEGNHYIIDFGAHSTSMTVNSNSVDVIYDDVEGDHMGSGNGHKTYSKDDLAKLIKDQRQTIDDVLSFHQGSQTGSEKHSTKPGLTEEEARQKLKVFNIKYPLSELTAEDHNGTWFFKEPAGKIGRQMYYVYSNGSVASRYIGPNE